MFSHRNAGCDPHRHDSSVNRHRRAHDRSTRVAHASSRLQDGQALLIGGLNVEHTSTNTASTLLEGRYWQTVPG